MEETAVGEVDAGPLACQCHIDEHPIPKLVIVVFGNATDVEGFGEVQLGEG
jgi:hypothetical protein